MANNKNAQGAKKSTNNELVNRFNSVKPQVRGLQINKETNIEKGELSIGSQVIEFNREAYRQKELSPSQKAWIDQLDENDCLVPVCISNPTGKFPFSTWLSTLKGLDGVTADNDKLSVKQGNKYKIMNGVLMIV